MSDRWKFGEFVCPSCGGRWFGTVDSDDPQRRRVVCHDQLGKHCRWVGRGEDAGLKYPFDER